MKDIVIMEKCCGEEVKLTNNLDFNVSCDLIMNSPYYLKTYGHRFSPGMRLDCNMTPFVMRINHDDYNFMMKCLFWNVTFDDNAEGYLFDGVQKPQGEAPPAEPMYLNLSMERIAMCVTEKGFPLSVLLLNKMGFALTMNEEGMNMNLEMKNLFGTYITRVDEEKSIEKGMFNAFGHEQ